MTERNGSATPSREVDEDALAINAEHEAGERAHEKSLEHYLRAGQLLAAKRAELLGDMSPTDPRSPWGPWMRAHLRFSKQTACRYIRFAELAGRKPGLRADELDELWEQSRPQHTPRPKATGLLALLRTLTAGLAPRETIEQSTAFVFTDREIVTFNDEVACRCAFPTDLPSDLHGAVNAKKLMAALAGLGERVSVTAEGDELVLTSGDGGRSYFYLDKEILLPAGSVDKPDQWRPLTEKFTEAVRVVQTCAGTDASMFASTCVHLHPEWVEAYDNFQVCRWKIETGVRASVLVRRASINHVASLGMTEMAETEHWLHFRNDTELTLSCRRYEEEAQDFQDLGEALEGARGGIPIELPAGLAQAVNRANVFSSENAENNYLELVLSPEGGGTLTVRGRGFTGRHEETLAFPGYTGEEMRFLIAPQLLLDLVKRHTDCLLGPGRLRVESESCVYVACLSEPDDEPAPPPLPPPPPPLPPGPDTGRPYRKLLPMLCEDVRTTWPFAVVEPLAENEPVRRRIMRIALAAARVELGIPIPTEGGTT